MRIAFDKALINSGCYTICGGVNTSVALDGIFYYHTSNNLDSLFLKNTTRRAPQADWLKDLNLPDLAPLGNVFLDHWKLMLAIACTLAGLTLLTYLLGPAVVLLGEAKSNETN